MSVNISKQKRDRLVEKINKIKTYIASAKQDENTAQLLAYIADIEKDIKGKKYGLVFEEHREAIDEILEQNTPVLTEDKDLYIDNGGQMNFLIEGDNLAALQLLEKTHKGKIDLIYIDPPYNKGEKDFVYDDDYVEANDTFRHSKWLSFIEKKLQLAKQLLARNGLIFISIDDKEQSALKMLCDAIFNENNFIATLHWKKKKQPSYLHGQVAGVMEYILIFSKNKQETDKLSLSSPTDANTRVDNASNQVSQRVIRKGIRVKLSPFISIIKKGIYINKTMETEFLNDVIIKNGRTCNDVIAKARFRDSQERIDLFCKEDVLFITKNCGFRRDKLKEERNKKKAITDLILDWGDNQDSDKELREIFGSKVFDYPKPTLLIQNIIKSINNDNAIILDFFAGSGTTGHAVMKLNAEDGGKRKFILCTNNENNICRDVTYERIKRVIARDKYEASLKYYKVDFVPISDKLYYEYADELLKHIRELVELENGVNFNDNAEIAIVLTEKELDAFAASIPDKCKTIYLGHDVLPSEVQESMFKARGIAVNIIPDYYYRELEG